MATKDRLEQNFVRKKHHSCRQYVGNLAEGAKFATKDSAQPKQHRTTQILEKWHCYVCSTLNGGAQERCKACKFQRTPKWALFPDGKMANVGQYIILDNSVFGVTSRSAKLPAQFHESITAGFQTDQNLVGLIITIDFIRPALVIFFSAVSSMDGTNKFSISQKHQQVPVELKKWKPHPTNTIQTRIPADWISNGFLGNTPLNMCPPLHCATFGSYQRCANPACYRVYRLQFAEQRHTSVEKRQESRAQVSLHAQYQIMSAM